MALAEPRTSPAASRAASRLRSTEGLRAVAALAVLAHHVVVFVPASDGAMALPAAAVTAVKDLGFGLTLFFALSGFLLFRPFAAAILGAGPVPDVRAYARNRLLRILPLYWVVLLVSALVLSAAIAHPPFGTGRITDPGTLLADLLLVQGYSASTILTGIGPAWSLAVELVFYAVLPLLAWAALALLRPGAGPRARLLAACAPAVALLALGLASKQVLEVVVPNLSPAWALVTRLSFPANADQFAFGMLAAVAHVLAAQGRLRPGRAGRRAAAVGALVVFALALALAGRRGHMHASGEHTLVALAAGLAIWALVAPRPHGARRGPLQALLESRPLVWGGLVSYGIYLWHTPVQALLARAGLRADDAAGALVAVLLCLAVVLPLSHLTYRLVEAPALARKRPMLRAGATPAGAPAAPGAERERRVAAAVAAGG